MLYKIKKLLLVTLVFLSLSGFSQDIGLELGFGTSKTKVYNDAVFPDFFGNSEILSSSFTIKPAVIVSFKISESFKIETGIHCEFFKKNGDFSWSIPLIGKYYTNPGFGFYDKKGELKTASGFHLRLGIAYRNDEGRYVSSDLYSINVISLVLGIGFDINETLTIVADYSQQLSNSQSNSQTFIDDSIKTNRLGVSIQFFF
tara:strand:- start:58 stop:660 length:603 start_codon:yes stop_codon:yes gene_type:complete